MSSNESGYNTNYPRQDYHTLIKYAVISLIVIGALLLYFLVQSHKKMKAMEVRTLAAEEIIKQRDTVRERCLINEKELSERVRILEQVANYCAAHVKILVTDGEVTIAPR